MPTLNQQQIDELRELYEQRGQSAEKREQFIIAIHNAMPAIFETLAEKERNIVLLVSEADNYRRNMIQLCAELQQKDADVEGLVAERQQWLTWAESHRQQELSSVPNAPRYSRRASAMDTTHSRRAKDCRRKDCGASASKRADSGA